MKMKINKYIPIGIILIIIGIGLYLLSGIDQFIRPFTQPILMGSSKGKDILFFVLFGMTLILSTIGDNEKIVKWFKSLDINKKLKNRRFYLKLSLLLFLITAISGLIIEIYLRYTLGIGIFTIFVSMNPNLTTTSILHSHLYKSLFGVILSNVLTYIPVGIHTGSSLEVYTPQITKLLFFLIPLTYIVMVISIQRRKPISRVFLSFTSTLGIIGIIDGGLFATPAVGGIYGILVILYNEVILDHISDFLFKRKKDKNKSNNKNSFDKSKINVKIILKMLIPHLLLIFIIFLRFSIAFYGASPDSYELIISNPQDVDLNQYEIINIVKSPQQENITISNKYNEMELLNKLAINLEGKCDWYSLSWNIYSYL